jgi:hypothetical protein
MVSLLMKRPSSRWSSCALGLLLVLAMSSCGDRTLDVRVQLLTQTCEDRNGITIDVRDTVSHLEFIVTGDGIPQPLISFSSVSEGRAEIPDIPLGAANQVVRRRIEVNGRFGSVTGPIVARGAAVVEMTTDARRDITVPVFLRAVDHFAFTNGPDAPQTCSRMNRPRSGHTATLLPDGRVLIVGGAVIDEGGRTVHASAEIFDPNTGQFRLLEGPGAPQQPRVFHTATLLQDGRVLVAGGEYDAGSGRQVNRPAEIFDYRNDRFLEPILAPRGRSRHTATRVAGGQVFLAGGYTDPNPPSGQTHPLPTRTTDVFDPAAEAGRGAFIEGPELPDARAEHCAVTTQDGTRVVLAGGKTIRDSAAAVAANLQFFRLHPDDGRFVPLGSPHNMNTGRYGLACGVVKGLTGGDRVAMAGGFRQLGDFGDASAFAGVEIFNPNEAQSADLGSLTGGARGNLCAVQVSDGVVVFLGGYRQGNATTSRAADRLVLDDGTLQLQPVQGTLNDRRFFHRCTLLADGSVMVTGGEYPEAPEAGEPWALPTAEIYTPLGPR